MHTTISIYNLALARLGGHQLERINAPDDDTASATLCRTLYPHCVEMALSAFPWGFASRRATLAQKPDGNTPNPMAYPFRYALPADCLYPLSLDGEGKDHFPPPHILMEGDVLTPVKGAVLTYVARIEDPTYWPAAFADAVAWLLAAELATSLTNDARRQQMYMQKYESALLEARSGDLRRQQPMFPSVLWLEARQ